LRKKGPPCSIPYPADKVSELLAHVVNRVLIDLLYSLS